MTTVAAVYQSREYVKIVRLPYLSARNPQISVARNSPENSAAMKAAIPVVPKMPRVVGVRIRPATSAGATYAVKSRSYSSKNNPKLSRTTSFQIERVTGSLSSLAEISAPEMETRLENGIADIMDYSRGRQKLDIVHALNPSAQE